MATAADGMHPTGMHSCFDMCLLAFSMYHNSNSIYQAPRPLVLEMPTISRESFCDLKSFMQET